MRFLVSIIIPTHNRAHLIGETLESVITQTYGSWECIVVDDGSSDYTAELMEFYASRDKRISYHQRPKNKPKGANACRNYGFELSQGEFINWFDSDDIMTSNFIEAKLEALKSGSYDFCISKTKYFNLEMQDELYDFKSEDINNHNYITQRVNWLTYDAFIKREIAERISFNPNLESGQEFNFFSKLTLLTTNAILIDKHLTLRRLHSNSIQGDLRESRKKQLRGIYRAHWITYLDLKVNIEKRTRVYLMHKCIMLFFYLDNYYNFLNISLIKAVYIELGFKKSVFFCLANLTKFLFGKSYIFEKKVRHV